jgi:hypothetical protein
MSENYVVIRRRSHLQSCKSNFVRKLRYVRRKALVMNSTDVEFVKNQPKLLALARHVYYYTRDGIDAKKSHF